MRIALGLLGHRERLAQQRFGFVDATGHQGRAAQVVDDRSDFRVLRAVHLAIDRQRLAIHGQRLVVTTALVEKAREIAERDGRQGVPRAEHLLTQRQRFAQRCLGGRQIAAVEVRPAERVQALRQHGGALRSAFTIGG